MLFFVVFLLNWFLKRVNFIISKIKNNNRKNIMHIFIFCFLLLQYQMCIFASKCDEMCFCSFLAKFHINYARKLDHYRSDRHPWHRAENYA